MKVEARMKVETRMTVEYDAILAVAELEAARLAWEANGWYIVRVETSKEYIRVGRSPSMAERSIEGPTSTVIHLEGNIAP